MSCRTCLELEQFLRAAEEPDPPELLVGLTERGLINRALQREEKIKEQRHQVEKHKMLCRSPSDEANG